MVYVKFPKGYKRWNGSEMEGEWNIKYYSAKCTMFIPVPQKGYFITINPIMERQHKEALAFLMQMQHEQPR